MAIIPESQYPGKIAPANAEYPYGKARNIALPGDGTGTPWEAALVNDLFGFQQALLSEAKLTPTGNPEKVGASQYVQSLRTIFSLSAKSLSELKARPTSELVSGIGLFLYVLEKSGPFTWDPSDLSVKVTGDPDGAVYVAPNSDPTGASGAWVRDTGGKLNAGWFGFSISGSSANNSAALDRALKYALTLGGRRVEVDAGSYSADASAGAVVDGAGVYLEGAGREATIINLSGNGDFLTFKNTGRGWGVKNMSLKYAVPPTTGSVISGTTAALSGNIEGLFILSCFDGVTLGNAQSTRIEHIEIWDFKSSGVKFAGNLNDVYCENWFLNGSNNPSAVGWRIDGKAHAMLASNIEIIQCNQPCAFVGAAGTVNTVAFSRLFNCFFDSSTSPAYYQYLYDVEFHGCWWSQRETGAVFFDSKTVKFFGGSATNCNRHGMIWDSGCEDFEAHGFTWDSNSQESVGTYNGLVVAAGVWNFRIFGGYSGNAGVAFPSAQGNGIFLNGTNDNYIINGVKFDGNTGSPIDGHNPSRDRRVVLCQGFVTRNAGEATVTTDAGGLASIPHGLSARPNSAFLALTGNSVQEATVISTDATNINVRVRDTTTNANLSGGTVSIMWQANAET